MELSIVIIFVALCLGLTVGQIQLRVYRGTLVHSRELKQIEVLQDHLLGFDANNHGEVSAAACLSVAMHAPEIDSNLHFSCMFYNLRYIASDHYKS